MGNGNEDDRSARALAIVIEALKDPSRRKQFANHPRDTLKHILGDDVNDLDQGVADFLASLTYEELRVMSQLEDTLEAAQMTVQAGGHTLGKL